MKLAKRNKSVYIKVSQEFLDLIAYHQSKGAGSASDILNEALADYTRSGSWRVNFSEVRELVDAISDISNIKGN